MCQALRQRQQTQRLNKMWLWRQGDYSESGVINVFSEVSQLLPRDTQGQGGRALAKCGGAVAPVTNPLEFLGLPENKETE